MTITTKVTCDICGCDVRYPNGPDGPVPVIPTIVQIQTNNAGPSGDFCGLPCALKWLLKPHGEHLRQEWIDAILGERA